ncbi:MFS transporter [Streptomyces sp. IB2014 016-6]|uniref:MFS transporter n=1 Tax=Streptomyces sp. IB2014 016-6 TaxID=2517818 RepID=UPI0011CC02EF|nr:MFS transporter [Streptomyces sp. IB2014 016-6]TXL87179.1 hypothetical protein EW053_23110 [Streptomyces sp. IB2014 016-6]
MSESATQTTGTTVTGAPPPPSRQSARTRALALGVLASGMLMIVLDGSIVTVAMPAIQDDLGFSPGGRGADRRLPPRVRRRGRAAGGRVRGGVRGAQASYSVRSME